MAQQTQLQQNVALKKGGAGFTAAAPFAPIREELRSLPSRQRHAGRCDFT